MLSILAGFMIGIGAIVYLTVGGVAGALLFAVGLMTICCFKMELFTGKVGLFAEGKIDCLGMIRIWFGNFIGVLIAAMLILSTHRGEMLSETARNIVAIKVAATPVENFILGVFCGLLMFVAVSGYSEHRNILFVYVPVAVFILSGFNHCVADMFYLSLGAQNANDFLILIPITLGNVVGGSIIPLVRRSV